MKWVRSSWPEGSTNCLVPRPIYSSFTFCWQRECWKINSVFLYTLICINIWTKNLSKKIYHGQTYVLRFFFLISTKLKKYSLQTWEKEKYCRNNSIKTIKADNADLHVLGANLIANCCSSCNLELWKCFLFHPNVFKFWKI